VESNNVPSMRSLAQAALMLGISKITLRRLLWARRLGCYRVGNKIFLSDEQISEFLDGAELKPEAADRALEIST
jgi:excisionase family DNA binding protein